MKIPSWLKSQLFDRRCFETKLQESERKTIQYVRFCHFFTFLIWSPSCYFVRFFSFESRIGVTRVQEKKKKNICWYSTISCTQTVRCWHCCYPADIQKNFPSQLQHMFALALGKAESKTLMKPKKKTVGKTINTNLIFFTLHSDLFIKIANPLHTCRKKKPFKYSC